MPKQTFFNLPDEKRQRIEELRDLARTMTHDTGNDFFRVLQILEHLRPTQDPS